MHISKRGSALARKWLYRAHATFDGASAKMLEVGMSGRFPVSSKNCIAAIGADELNLLAAWTCQPIKYRQWCYRKFGVAQGAGHTQL